MRYQEAEEILLQIAERYGCKTTLSIGASPPEVIFKFKTIKQLECFLKQMKE